MRRRKTTDFLFSISQCGKLSWMNLSVLCLRNFPGAKKIMDKNGGGISSFSVEVFFVSQCRKFHKGTLLCCVSKNLR